MSPFRLTLFGGGVFAVESGFFAVVPPLVPRLAQELHLTTTELGILVAAYPAGVVAGAIPSIALVYRAGVRVTAFIGLGLLIAATLGFGLASTGVVIDAARFVQGFGGAVAWAGALAWLTGTTSELRRGAVIGAAVGAALFGTVFGPLVGALAADVGRGPVFGALAVVLALLAVLAPAVAPAAEPVRGSVRALIGLLRNRQAALGNGALFVVGVAGGTAWTLTPLLVSRLGGTAVTIAWMVGVGYLIAAVLNVFTGRLSDRVGRLLPTVVLFAISAVTLPLLPIYGSLAPLVVTSVVTGAVLSGLWTPTAAMVADAAAPGPSAQAIGVAAMNAAWAAGGATGPVVMASIAENAGFVTPFVSAGALCALTAVTAVATYRRRRVEDTWTSA
ncbi:MAG TPA: MFS transporter [Methylomirabilota bacterium]|nr:MFS transporter [Methylomirabilota bacterium]